MNAGLTYWIDNIINMKRSNPFLICKRIFRNLLLDLLLVLDFKSIFPWKNCSFYGSFGKLLYHAHNLRISSNRFALKICVSLHWRHSTTTCGSTLLLFYTTLSFLKIVFMLCKTHFHQNQSLSYYPRTHYHTFFYKKELPGKRFLSEV